MLISDNLFQAQGEPPRKDGCAAGEQGWVVVGVECLGSG